eukprot:TRINITY_DN280_c2_g1_i2.p1 TRINITY_DN280_c2_g1~~TRINITY_DN280_c2_g1_i2.p1  ORF type:complete len:400 (+),score=73.65 TRINITY_DN280_c2_g1_i2:155-1354(+)
MKRTRCRVKSACLNCRKRHVGCDKSRPCARCIKNGWEDTCVDAPRKRSRRKEPKKSKKGSAYSPEYPNDGDGEVSEPFYEDDQRFIGSRYSENPDYEDHYDYEPKDYEHPLDPIYDDHKNENSWQTHQIEVKQEPKTRHSGHTRASQYSSRLTRRPHPSYYESNDESNYESHDEQKYEQEKDQPEPNPHHEGITHSQENSRANDHDDTDVEYSEHHEETEPRYKPRSKYEIRSVPNNDHHHHHHDVKSPPPSHQHLESDIIISETSEQSNSSESRPNTPETTTISISAQVPQTPQTPQTHLVNNNNYNTNLNMYEQNNNSNNNNSIPNNSSSFENISSSNNNLWTKDLFSNGIYDNEQPLFQLPELLIDADDDIHKSFYKTSSSSTELPEDPFDEGLFL